MAEISADLVYEVLKSVQHGISQIKGEMGEIKHRMAASQISQNAVRQEIVGVHTELAGIHATLIRHGHQLDHIERRLDLNDTLPLTA
jgi:septal ring factor EnvC (AmiA/AmiB activator)